MAGTAFGLFYYVCRLECILSALGLGYQIMSFVVPLALWVTTLNRLDHFNLTAALVPDLKLAQHCFQRLDLVCNTAKPHFERSVRCSDVS